MTAHLISIRIIYTMGYSPYSTKKLQVWHKILIGFLVTGLLVGTAWFFFTRFQEQPSTAPVSASDILKETPSSETGAESTENVDAATELGIEPEYKEITFYIDAWGLELLKNNEITASSEDGSDLGPVTFTVLTDEELKLLVTQQPKLVTSMLSNLYSPDSRLACNNSKCLIGDKEVDVTSLLDLSTIPVFGEVYKENGIDSGIYKASVKIPEQDLGVYLEAENYSPYFFNLIDFNETGDNLYSPLDQNSESFYISAGLGRIFPVSPAWSTSSKLPLARWHSRIPSSVGEESIKTLEEMYSTDPFTKGIGSVYTDTSAGLTPHQLTYLTSPVSGCGLSTLCTINDVTVNRVELVTDSGLVCSVDGEKLLLVSTFSKWKTTLPSKTHVLGFWGVDQDPLTFTNAPNYQSVLGYLGEPPLVEGPLEFYNLNLYLLDQNGIVEIEAARSINKEDVPLINVANVSNAFDGKYSPC